jgi:hypothetical protein
MLTDWDSGFMNRRFKGFRFIVKGWGQVGFRFRVQGQRFRF